MISINSAVRHLLLLNNSLIMKSVVANVKNISGALFTKYGIHMQLLQRFWGDLITHPSPKFNGDLTKPPFKLLYMDENDYPCPNPDAGLANLF